MQVGNARYLTAEDLPETVPVFPLTGALLLPAGQLPLNIFEPRYLELFDFALRGNRLIGMVQPSLTEPSPTDGGQAALAPVGCLGRITSFAETGDGRYIVSLSGLCRYRVISEVRSHHPFRQIRISPFVTDLSAAQEEESVDRSRLLATFRAYLEANTLEADWDSVQRASNLTLVNSLSMMSPFGPAEKQALLEAPDLKSRAETLIAITEIYLARGSGESDRTLQ
ncbi:LON peptidase substrate-binding domain-containing protein [Allorhizobium sp. BGMRC 0089]|uniref:LON peptidase substrate-binding domain-containing protein n=1 Tax=Allorhizobium sonneratiae TaxID=2934936 RepID=UPI002034A429|nr:LON peptidase substrate-binding domain-containing protein [Allorhizobium sonneratiae]MCM2293345.1 LON peptidase substrate-binding domain-containing protein [Allorhizobium sonneratiae]